MEFSLALIQDQQFALLSTFRPDQPVEVEKLDLQELAKVDLQATFFPSEIADTETSAFLKELILDNPVFPLSFVNLDEMKYRQLDFNSAHSLYKRTSSSWTLHNNLQTIEKIFEIRQALQTKWQKDPHFFFKDLWSILRTNLGTKFLRIVFHDLKNSQFQNETDLSESESQKGKPKLVCSSIAGQRFPEIFQGGERPENYPENYNENNLSAATSQNSHLSHFHHVDSGKSIEEQLIDQYHFPVNGEIKKTSFDSETGELVLTATLDNSPILIMAKVSDFSPVKESLLKGLFKGLIQ
jgi:hypothetical protein